MKRFFVLISVAVLLLGSCAKYTNEGVNDTAVAFLKSWLKKNHPDAKATGRGVYILENIPGKYQMGSKDAYPYILLDYVLTDLEGNIKDYTDAKTAQQLGEFKEVNTYTPQPYYRGEGGLPAGIEDAIEGMDIGGTRKVVIPGWLDTPQQYKTEQEYMDNVTGNTGIYYLTLRDQINDITKWEADSLGSFVFKNYGINPKDSLAFGYYFLSLDKPSDAEMPTDTTFNINYTGRLLNGQVFDTTIRDTAVVHGIYSKNKDYTTSSVQMAENFKEITLDSSAIIEGFSYTLSKMHPGERALGMFISLYGYSNTGSGKTIPPLSPLIFEIEIVKK